MATKKKTTKTSNSMRKGRRRHRLPSDISPLASTSTASLNVSSSISPPASSNSSDSDSDVPTITTFLSPLPSCAPRSGSISSSCSSISSSSIGQSGVTVLSPPDCNCDSDDDDHDSGDSAMTPPDQEVQPQSLSSSFKTPPPTKTTATGGTGTSRSMSIESTPSSPFGPPSAAEFHSYSFPHSAPQTPNSPRGGDRSRSRSRSRSQRDAGIAGGGSDGAKSVCGGGGRLSRRRSSLRRGLMLQGRHAPMWGGGGGGGAGRGGYRNRLGDRRSRIRRPPRPRPPFCRAGSTPVLLSGRSLSMNLEAEEEVRNKSSSSLPPEREEILRKMDAAARERELRLETLSTCSSTDTADSDLRESPSRPNSQEAMVLWSMRERIRDLEREVRVLRRREESDFSRIRMNSAEETDSDITDMDMDAVSMDSEGPGIEEPSEESKEEVEEEEEQEQEKEAEEAEDETHHARSPSQDPAEIEATSPIETETGTDAQPEPVFAPSRVRFLGTRIGLARHRMDRFMERRKSLGLTADPLSLPRKSLSNRLKRLSLSRASVDARVPEGLACVPPGTGRGPGANSRPPRGRRLRRNSVCVSSPAARFGRMSRRSGSIETIVAASSWGAKKAWMRERKDLLEELETVKEEHSSWRWKVCSSLFLMRESLRSCREDWAVFRRRLNHDLRGLRKFMKRKLRTMNIETKSLGLGVGAGTGAVGLIRRESRNLSLRRKSFCRQSYFDVQLRIRKSDESRRVVPTSLKRGLFQRIFNFSNSSNVTDVLERPWERLLVVASEFHNTLSMYRPTGRGSPELVARTSALGMTLNRMCETLLLVDAPLGFGASMRADETVIDEWYDFLTRLIVRARA